MADDTLLSHLCGICYNQEPKYRCPGCNARTCSLPCYQKHRQQASCSGKRDPAAYIKKSQWATPAGIDRDYNYLRGVERALDHADHALNNAPTGSPDSTSALKNVARGRHPNSVLQRYLAHHRITVQHAPLGMTRQKTNQTRPTKRNNIVWTVEWIAPHEDYRHLEHDGLESTAVATLYASLRAERGTKRKRGHPGQDDVRIPTENKSSPPPDEPLSTTKDDPLTAPEEPPSVPQAKPSQPSPAQHAFYLLKPSTTSPSKILIPLNPQASLTETLQDRIVQEYPTIYVFPSPSVASEETEDRSAPLPAGFILESDYEDQRQQEEKELNGMLTQTAAASSSSSLPALPSGAASSSTARHAGDGQARGSTNSKEDAAIDAQGILAMLKKDVRGRRGM